MYCFVHCPHQTRIKNTYTNKTKKFILYSYVKPTIVLEYQCQVMKGQCWTNPPELRNHRSTGLQTAGPGWYLWVMDQSGL